MVMDFSIGFLENKWSLQYMKKTRRCVCTRSRIAIYNTGNFTCEYENLTFWAFFVYRFRRIGIISFMKEQEMKVKIDELVEEEEVVIRCRKIIIERW